MFDAYIRSVTEKGDLIFPEDFCFTKKTEEDKQKKALDEIEAILGPYLYAGNYFNNPVADELVEFKQEWFRHFSIDNEYRDKTAGAKCIISIDPATRLKETNDPTGIAITKIDTDGFVYVEDAWSKKYRPNELITEIFKLNDLYDPDVVSIETVSAQILWTDLLNQEMKRTGKNFRLEEYDPGTRETKASKIRKLIPYYARGQILHKNNLFALERELVEFPRNRHDDIIDALQAQIPFWSGTTIVKKEPLVKYSEAWWDELRRGSLASKGTAQEKLFEEYKKPITKPIIRKPTW